MSGYAYVLGVSVFQFKKTNPQLENSD